MEQTINRSLYMANQDCANSFSLALEKSPGMIKFIAQISKIPVIQLYAKDKTPSVKRSSVDFLGENKLTYPLTYFQKSTKHLI